MNTMIRDWQFYLCLGLGPLAWLILATVYPVREAPGLPPLPWHQVVLVLLVFPVLEEVVFRGLVLDMVARQFSKRFGPLTLANVLTSLLFVAAHLFHNPPVWALLVFFPSLIFGYLKERHRTLLSPILMHGFYNLGFYLLFWQ